MQILELNFLHIRMQKFKDSFNIIIILNLGPSKFTNLILMIELYDWNQCWIIIGVCIYDLLYNSYRNILTLI